jgi:hypothetical protein
MKHFLLLLLSFFSFFLMAVIQPASAQQTPPRYAECDVCGYCRTNGKVPGTWDSCRACVYPDIRYQGNLTSEEKALQNKTLQVDTDPSSPTFNIQVTPMPGTYFTIIGCINTDLTSFEDKGAAGNVVNRLLGIINSVAGAIAFVYLIYGSYVIMMAKGDPGKLAQGRGIVFGAIGGLIFTFCVGLILNLLGAGILRIPGFGG